jgi:hypothetical protein
MQQRRLHEQQAALTPCRLHRAPVRRNIRMKPFFRLPLDFDPQRLSDDLRICETLQWTPHFNTRDYSGEWSSIALRSASGSASDIHSHPTENAYRDTALLGACRYFADVLGSFQCEKESVRLLRLAGGAHIKEHRDVQAGYQFGFFRVHIPIQTSDQVRFLVAGQALDMAAGECWYADFSQTHSVENCGNESRVNLILDCKRNDWSDSLFAQAGYDFEQERRRMQFDRATRAKVIAELSGHKTEAAENLIRQLLAEAELDE